MLSETRSTANRSTTGMPALVVLLFVGADKPQQAKALEALSALLVVGAVHRSCRRCNTAHPTFAHHPSSPPSDGQPCEVPQTSASVRHGVQAHAREVVSLARMERPSRFMYPLPNCILCFGRKGSQYG